MSVPVCFKPTFIVTCVMVLLCSISAPVAETTVAATHALHLQEANAGVRITPLIEGELVASELPVYRDFWFYRHRLEPGTSISVGNSGFGSTSDDREWVESDFLYVESGVVSVTGPSGEMKSYDRGQSFQVEGGGNPGDYVEIASASRSCVSLLHLEAAIVTYPPELAGGQEASHTPSIPGDPCKGEATYDVYGRDFSPTMRPYLARVEMDGGATWNFGSSVSDASVVVEDGSVFVGDSNGGEIAYGPDNRIIFNSNDPHVIQNPNADTARLLIFGMAATPGGDSVIELHMASCSSGATGGDYFGQCHQNGDLDIPMSLNRDQTFKSQGSSIRTVTSSLSEPGPGVVIFRGLASGFYQLVDAYPERSVTGEIFVLCSDQSAGLQSEAQIVLEFRGSADTPIGIDVPEDSYLICDWYSNV